MDVVEAGFGAGHIAAAGAISRKSIWPVDRLFQPVMKTWCMVGGE